MKSQPMLLTKKKGKTDPYWNVTNLSTVSVATLGFKLETYK